MASENNSELLIRNLDPINMTPDEKKAKQTCKNTLLQAAKRKQNAENIMEIQIPIKCDPTQYLLYDPPHNTVGHLIVQYLASL